MYCYVLINIFPTSLKCGENSRSVPPRERVITYNMEHTLWMRRGVCGKGRRFDSREMVYLCLTSMSLDDSSERQSVSKTLWGHEYDQRVPRMALSRAECDYIDIFYKQLSYLVPSYRLQKGTVQSILVWHCAENRRTLSSVVVWQIVIMITCGVPNAANVGIITTPDFQCCTPCQVSIRNVVIAIFTNCIAIIFVSADKNISCFAVTWAVLGPFTKSWFLENDLS